MAITAKTDIDSQDLAKEIMEVKNALAGLTATVTELNKLAGAGEVVASGTQVSHIADPAGGATTDTEARAAIASIIDALEAFKIDPGA